MRKREFRSCVRVEVAVLTSLMRVSVDVKQY